MTDNLTQWPEAQRITISGRIVIWYGESRRQVGNQVYCVVVQAVTSETHPARVHVRTTLTDDQMLVELVDNHGVVLNEQSRIVRPSSEPENIELLDELTRLIEEAGSARDAAKTLIDAGWQPPEVPEEYDDSD